MTQTQDHSQLSLEARIEAILFVAGEPVTVEALSRTVGCSRDEATRAVSVLEASLSGRGVRLVRHRDSVQLATAVAAAADIRRFLQAEPDATLSPAALEVLAVVAYRQPVTRAQVEAVRGVNCDSALRTLSRLGLIADVARLDQPGRPIAYGTTAAFLRLCGLSSLEELPPLPDE